MIPACVLPSVSKHLGPWWGSLGGWQGVAPQFMTCCLILHGPIVKVVGLCTQMACKEHNSNYTV